jgi:hypothetical protein
VRHPGDEARVRLIAEQSFPRQAFEDAGLVGFTVYVGAGYCVFEFGFEGPFEPVFARLSADPAANKFFDELEHHVEPTPRIEPGATADQPLAADLFMWRSESGIKAREPAR